MGIEEEKAENPEHYSSESEAALSQEHVTEIVNSFISEKQNKNNKSEILVGRYGLNDYGLWGMLFRLTGSAGYEPIGYTLEPTRNIPEKGYIPEGVYKFKQWDSTKLKKTLRLYSVPNFTNVLVHVGNTKVDTRGCILAGKSIDDLASPKRLVSSRAMVGFLYDNYASGRIAVEWI